MKFFRDYLGSFLVILLLAGAGYYYRENISVFTEELFARLQPCQRPITYSIASIDSRFGVSEATVLKDVTQAQGIWEAPVNRKLFAYSPNGGLKINLIYDNRQKATDTLRQLGIVINSDKATYEALKAKYDSFLAEYDAQKAQVATRIATYNADKDAYEKEVLYWNSRGGAPRAEYDLLQEKKATLDGEIGSINQAQASLNALSDNVNAVVTVLNKLVAELNLQGNEYNTVGASTGGEFKEGEYASDANGRVINIYQFDNEDKLVRVFAHEFGHALGLGHLNNPKAIMYYLNEGVNEKLTTDDLAALKAECRIN